MNGRFLLLYIYVGFICISIVFAAQWLKYVFRFILYFFDKITVDVLRQIFMLACSVTTTGLLIYNANYITDTSQLYGTNFTLAYSFGFIAFNILAMYIQFRTDFFSYADFFMRAQISRILTSLLDAYSLITMVDGIPLNSFTVIVFIIFIASLPYSIVPIWLYQYNTQANEYDFIKEANARKAKYTRFLTILINMIFVDIPYLVIRAIGYYIYSISLSSFIIKNGLNILGDSVEIFKLLTSGVSQEIKADFWEKLNRLHRMFVH